MTCMKPAIFKDFFLMTKASQINKRERDLSQNFAIDFASTLLANITREVIPNKRKIFGNLSRLNKH